MAIRQATDEDLQRVLAWLEIEAAAGVHGCFHCNRGVIESCHAKGDLFVLVEAEAEGPVAFLCGPAATPGILEVKADRRGKGYGKEMAEFMIQRAREEDVVLMEIECAPETSIPFWRRMGFTVYSGNRAFISLPVKHALPENAEPVEVEITWYPEAAKYTPETPPFRVDRPRAVRVGSGAVWIEESLVMFKGGPYSTADRDIVVSVKVDGKVLIDRDKAKYDEAANLGIEDDGMAFVADVLYPSVAR